MAKIIYGVAGEGFGHSSRSQLVGQRLIDSGHELLFAGSRKSLLYLKQYFGPRVHEVHGLSFTFEGGTVRPIRTFFDNLGRLPEARRTNRKLFKEVCEPFAPDLVISDFEPFTAWWAWRKKIPYISIDNEHVLVKCKLEHRRSDWFSRLTASLVTGLYYFGAASYIIINFFQTPPKSRRVVLAPPVVRPEVTALTAEQGSHVVIYSTSADRLEELTALLASFENYEFRIYGFDIEDRRGNCTFKKRSTEGFLADLASARGVIASAGFSLISECLYFRKPMCLIPVAGQYEQIINTHYIEKLGLGVASDKLDAETIARFLETIESPTSTHPDILWPDNERFFRILQEELNKLPTPVSIITK